MHFLMSSLDGISNIISLMTLSIMLRRPLAPVFRFTASATISSIASSSNSSSTPSSSKSFLYCFTKAFLGSRSILFSASSFNSCNPAYTGTRPMNSGINPYLSKSIGRILKILPMDLLRYGLIPEFIGRVPVYAGLHELKEDALKRILLEPKNALVKQYKKLFELDGVELEFDDEAIDEIVAEAVKRNTGARGLRSIIESVMRDIMFEIPSRDDIKKCIVTRETISEGVRPKLVYGESKRKRIKKEENVS